MKQSRNKKIITPEKTEQQAIIFSNRLKKWYKHLAKRFRKNNIDVFRLYDWDIPEVRAVVDWYAGRLVISEYVRQQTTDEWLERMAVAAGEALNIDRNHIYLKRRKTSDHKGARYQRLKQNEERFEVNERDLKFWVNLDDFLDTGLFSDHRDTRVLVRELADGEDFLNLFSYTGAFSCAAAAGGAKSIVTVDRSATYIKWAQDNFKLNNLKNDAWNFVQADTDEYLRQAQKEGKRFSLVFVDPPSFSQRRTDAAFDVNRDHPKMLEDIIKITKDNGTIIFSNNHQRFEPKFSSLKSKKITELTPKTIPEDYRNRKVHRCWKIEL